jgi:hypothetical protein
MSKQYKVVRSYGPNSVGKASNLDRLFVLVISLREHQNILRVTMVVLATLSTYFIRR